MGSIITEGLQDALDHVVADSTLGDLLEYVHVQFLLGGGPHRLQVQPRDVVVA